MSESLTVEGWRVRADVPDFVDAPFEVRSLSCRFAGGAIGAARSFGGRSLPPTSWARPRVRSRERPRPVRRDRRQGHPGLRVPGIPARDPGWILLLRLEGLYDRDEERTDHSTVDDIVGVFRSVTIGVWVFALFGVATNLVQPVLARLGVFWLVAVVLIPTLRAVARVALPPSARLHAERGHRRRGQRRPAARAQAARTIASTASTSSGFVDDRPTELDDELARAAPAAPRRARPAPRVSSSSTGSSA